MKYIYVITALLFIGCSDKSPTVEKAVETQVKDETTKVVESTATELKEEAGKVIESQKVEEKISSVKTHALKSNETMVDEPKVTKKIASDVPTSCAMWSDGANICTRISKRKASCTTNPVKYRNISCLQWQ